MSVLHLDPPPPASGSTPLLDLAGTGLPAPWDRPGPGHDPLPAASPCILVVEDDEDARDSLTALLRGHGMSVVQAGRGDAALELASLLPLSAVVLDVVLPDLSGFDVCRALRADPATRNVPVIMVTALTGLEDEVSGVLAGADAFVVKPVPPDRLLLHLQDLI